MSSRSVGSHRASDQPVVLVLQTADGDVPGIPMDAGWTVATAAAVGDSALREAIATHGPSLLVLHLDVAADDHALTLRSIVADAGGEPVLVAVDGAVSAELMRALVAAGAVDVQPAAGDGLGLAIERELARRSQTSAAERGLAAALVERTKELTALHSVVGRLLRVDDLATACRLVAETLHRSLQVPEAARVSVTVGDDTCVVGATGRPEARLRQAVRVGGVVQGSVEAAYVGEHTFLDPEEHDLVRSLADLLAGWVRHHAATARGASLFREALEGILFVDDAAVVVEANPAVARILDVEVADLTGRPLRDLYLQPEGDPDLFAPAWAQLRRDGTYVDEFLVRRPDGQLLRVAISGVANAMPGLHLIIARDVTARYRAELELRRSEERFREFAERLAEGIFVLRTRPQERFEYVNPALTRLTGVDSDRLYARASTLGGALSQDAARQLWAALTRSGEPSPAAEVDVDAGGELRRLRVHGTQLREPDGTLSGVLAVVTDLTHEHGAQAALASALEHERHLSILKSGFVQAVSHELRTPLTTVRGFVEVLLHRDVEPDAQLDYLRRIDAGAGRLARIVDDVLDLERLERAEVSPVRADVDLADAVLVAVEGLDPAGRDLRLDLTAAVVTGDHRLLEQVARCLIGNALRHTPESTAVRVTTRPPGTLVVADDGPGIPDGLRERVFEAFEQGPSPAVSTSPGTGIGLTLARRIVELHDGSIELTEPAGGGCRFTVTLPPAG